MKQAILIVVAACTAALLVSMDADAKRLGGGRSVGAPRDVATQRQMTPPPQNAAPATAAAPAPAAAAAKGVNTPPPAAAQPGWRRWIGPVAGIAAGLGIAALMSHMGLSEGFGNFLVILLLIVAAVVIVRLVLRRFAAKPAASQDAQGLQYAGAGAGSAAAGASPGSFGGSSIGSGTMGGSASAGTAGAGHESQGTSYGSAGASYGSGSVGTTGAVAGSVAAMSDTSGDTGGPRPYPVGFEPEPFLHQAKINFASLQSAYDRGDVDTLRDVMTPEMFSEVSRDVTAGGTQHPTDIVRLNAEILEVVSDAEYHWATVRFHGLTREDGVETPQPFDEAWNLRKAVDGSSGWMLAGIQQLQ